MSDESLFKRYTQQGYAWMDKGQFGKAFKDLEEAAKHTTKGDNRYPIYQLVLGMYYWFLAEKSWRFQKKSLRGKAADLFSEVINSKASACDKDRARAYLSVYYFINKEYYQLPRMELGKEDDSFLSVEDRRIPEYALQLAINSLVAMKNDTLDGVEASLVEAGRILGKFPPTRSLPFLYARHYYWQAMDQKEKLRRQRQIS